MECTNWSNQHLGRALRKAYKDIVLLGDANVGAIKDTQDYFEEARRRLDALALVLGLKVEKTSVIKD